MYSSFIEIFEFRMPLLNNTEHWGKEKGEWSNAVKFLMENNFQNLFLQNFAKLSLKCLSIKTLSDMQ